MLDTAINDMLMASGPDQISSQYMITFFPITGGKTFTPANEIGLGNAALSLKEREADLGFLGSQQMSIRAGVLDLPERRITTGDVWYQGKRIRKTLGKEDSPKEFTIEYRIDENWEVYRMFNIWYSLVFNEIDGTSNKEKDTRTVMSVTFYGANNKITSLMTFKEVKLVSMNPASLDPQSGDPLKINCGFIYHNYDWQQM